MSKGIKNDLQYIDELAEEILKTRGIDLDAICVKVLIITYMLYCANTFNVKYQNEDGVVMRANAGCIILCQKGTGKSRTLSILKKIFEYIDFYRYRQFEKKRKSLLEQYTKHNGEEKNLSDKEAQKRVYEEIGTETLSMITDTSTSKALCEAYQQIKKYNLDNLFFNIDEAGDRVFRDAFSFTSSQSAREFYQSINQLFDGYCGMGKSRTANKEGITSQSDVGANFVFVSTSEFLKDKNIQQKFLSGSEGGLGRRLLFFNSPPIDKTNVSRERLSPNFDGYQKTASEVYKRVEEKNINYGSLSQVKKVSEELWQVLEKKGAGSNISIEEEFLLLNFCVGLAAFMETEEITLEQWNYMVDLYHQLQTIGISFVNDKTTSYEKICIFIRNWLSEHEKKEVPVVLVKDYCIKERLCFEEKFEKYFDRLLKDFSNTNLTRFLIEKNTEKNTLSLSENFAYKG